MILQAMRLLAIVAIAYGSPFPQGVTIAIPPSAAAPSGCMATYNGKFGIALMSAKGGGNEVATQSADGQPGAATSTAAAVSQISDAQPQAPTGGVSQIADGQPQAPTGAVSQIGDGQPQAPTAVVSQIGDGQPQAPTMTMHAMSQIHDGQVQGYYSIPAVTQLGDGQPQAPTAGVSQIGDGQPQAPTGVSQIGDGQPQAPTAVSQVGDGQPQATGSSSSGSGANMVACQTDSTLELTLAGGVLKDSKGRTGYIASNYQFQFDDPPQTGAIYTAGFSVCGNGSLALGDSTLFYQCLSGSFYNLYNKNWAPQCEPVSVNVVKLVTC